MNNSLLCFMCLFVSTAVSAQSRDVVVERVEGARGDKFAVIVGINQFDDAGITRLDYAVADAEAIQKMLTDPAVGAFRPENVRLLTDKSPSELQPTRRNILASLQLFARNAQANDTLLLYFGGHGIEDFLIPKDAALNALDDTAIPVRRVNEILGESAAKRLVVIYDCCHSGGAKRGAKASETMERRLEEEMLKGAEGRVTLSSCSRNEVAYEWPDRGHGVFTAVLLDALQGKPDDTGASADVNRDGVITATEAAEFVQRGVKRWAIRNEKVQTPRLQADISGPIALTVLTGPEPPPPQPGDLIVKVTGTVGARVYVGTEQRGIIPCELHFPKSRDVVVTAAPVEGVEIRAELEGFEAATQRVVPGRDEAVSFDLRRLETDLPPVLLLSRGNDEAVVGRADAGLRAELPKVGVRCVGLPQGMSAPATKDEVDPLRQLVVDSGQKALIWAEVTLDESKTEKEGFRVSILIAWTGFNRDGEFASGTGRGNASSTNSRDRALELALKNACQQAANSILKGLTPK